MIGATTPVAASIQNNSPVNRFAQRGPDGGGGARNTIEFIAPVICPASDPDPEGHRLKEELLFPASVSLYNQPPSGRPSLPSTFSPTESFRHGFNKKIRQWKSCPRHWKNLIKFDVSANRAFYWRNEPAIQRPWKMRKNSIILFHIQGPELFRGPVQAEFLPRS